MKKRIGIFGGTFNPIHFGHLLNAQFIFDEFKLNKIIFVPAFIPPLKNFKNNNSLHRIKMIKMAIKKNKNFEFSDFEISQKKISYTIYTLQYFSKPEIELFFILGDDWLEKFNQWHRYKEIFNLANLIVMRRKYLKPYLPKFLNKFKNKIFFASNPIIGINSTLIRERIKNNLSIKYFVPDNVLKYLERHNIYK